MVRVLRVHILQHFVVVARESWCRRRSSLRMGCAQQCICAFERTRITMSTLFRNMSANQRVWGAIGAVIITGTVFKVSTIGESNMPIQRDPVILGLFQRVIVLLAATVSIESNRSTQTFSLICHL